MNSLEEKNRKRRKRIAKGKHLLEQILFEDSKICIHCGEKAAGPDGLCPACGSLWDKTSSRHLLSEDPYFVVYSASFYNNFLKDAFADYKFRKKSYWAPVFAQMLDEYVHAHPLLSQASWITYIPMSKGRKMRRGYNPCQEMACFVSKKEGIVLLDALRKKGKTKEQNKLSGRARRKNVEGAFSVQEKGGRIAGKMWNDQEGKWMEGWVSIQSLASSRGILVDDFLTTGNTMREGLQTLFERGIVADGLTLASVSYPRPEEAEKGRQNENCISRTVNDFERDAPSL